MNLKRVIPVHLKDFIKQLKRSYMPTANPWSSAQEWELGNSIAYMSNEGFKKQLWETNSKDFRASKGYVDPTELVEFFSEDKEIWTSFISDITDKVVMEIGPCLIAKIAHWDVASRRIAIEPLYSQISQYQDATFGMNGFPGVEVYAVPAEKLLPEFIGLVDGALLVRNCIDHSPYWAFILGNIAQYIAPGGQLLIWNDLLHPDSYRDGHYDICDDKELFRNLIVSLGFKIISEWESPTSVCLNYGCRAVKI